MEDNKLPTQLPEIQKAITRDTLVSVSVVVLIVSGALWINNGLSAIRSDIKALQDRMVDSLLVKDMKIWSQQLQIDNPTLKVPQVKP
jgi:hypothetical protein